ncbi:MAG TPA: M48 family metallopeptidase [Alphaproteobacteria bacterium]|nr:M48 family metallopeptidase [Alphaproteobacteria bacterium]
MDEAAAPPPGWPAEYSDGRVAIVHPALARLHASALIVTDRNDRELARWPTDEVRLIDVAGGKSRLRLARAGGDARLTVLSASALPALEAACPKLRRNAHGGPGWRAMALALGAAAAAAAFLFLVVIPLAAREAVYWVPPRMEVALGQRTAALLTGILRQVGKMNAGPDECDAPAGRAALDRLTATLVAAAKPRMTPHFRVINSPVVNALALPGGQILVFKGLIDVTAEPNELAGVLAHELAHEELGHPISIVIERGAGAFLIGLLLGDVVGGSMTVGAAQAVLEARFSRDAERAADARGVAILESAGLDPRPFGRFFARLATKDEAASGIPGFLQSHPPSAARAALVEAAPAGGRDAVTPADWLALKRICD